MNKMHIEYKDREETLHSIEVPYENDMAHVTIPFITDLLDGIKSGVITDINYFVEEDMLQYFSEESKAKPKVYAAIYTKKRSVDDPVNISLIGMPLDEVNKTLHGYAYAHKGSNGTPYFEPKV